METTIADQLERLIEALQRGDDRPLAGTPALGPRERVRVLETFNPAPAVVAPDQGVDARFRTIASAAPDAVAVERGSVRVTYRELLARAGATRRALERAGVREGDRVALAIDRSIEAVVGQVACALGGLSYVPLDPNHPDDRHHFQIDDTACAAVLVAPGADEGAERFGRPVVPVAAAGDGAADEPLEPRADRELYVMYTSGSTGRPKGVRVTHRGVLRLVVDAEFARLDADCRMLGYAPLAFDAATLEVWGPLLNGGTLVIPEADQPTLSDLAATLREQRVTTAWLTAALFHRMVDDHLDALRGLRELLAGGDVLSPAHVRRAREALPATTLINGYGPTENTTFTCCHRIEPGTVRGDGPIPIGRPIRGTAVYVLGPDGEPVPVGVPGEVWAGGDGVADGYVNRDALTRDAFVADPFSPVPGRTMYRTGDLAHWNDDGTLTFHGRADQQVKLRGFRIELGEVEAALVALPGVQQAVALVRGSEEEFGGKRLLAWIVADDGADVSVSALRNRLRETQPEHLIPTRIMLLEALPVTSNGKVDRRALPDPGRARPELAAPHLPPSTEVERAIASTWSDVLQVDDIGIDDPFFELGGTSLLALEVVEELRRRHELEGTVTDLFARPTVRALAAWFQAGAEIEATEADALRARVARSRRATSATRQPIAIVGWAARLPGADTVEAFWRNLVDGVESTRFFGPDELDPSVSPDEAARPDYVAARGILEDADHFDAGFFGVSPRVAELTDPQHRLFLETAWHALEDSGYVPETCPGAVGVWGGMTYSTYLHRNVWSRPDLVEAVGELQVRLHNEKDYAPIHVAHKLDLHGPAVSVHTACSTSLVAVAHAVLALRAGVCDLALAGGVNVTSPIRSGHRYVEGGMLSVDGHTRPFDAGARGTVFSDGVGIVVLKRLDEALADGDQIRAVIRGVGLSNDGAGRASFSAPNAAGQAAAIAMALDDAGLEADSIGYVEAHGTGTPLGDPIEVEGLTRAFRQTTDRTGFCALGSAKSNFGHTVAASGVTGLIKAGLCVQRGYLPPSLNYRSPNPAIDFDETPFRVLAEGRPWTADGPRRAGVSSFGVGGTNAHVVLEEPPARAAPTGADDAPTLLVLSARSPEALDAASEALAAHLAERPELALADVAHTLESGRRTFRHRRFVVTTQARASADLREPPAGYGGTGQVRDTAPPVAFLFPGQGSQYVEMGRALLGRDRVFERAMREASSILADSHGMDLWDVLYGEGDPDARTALLARTDWTQPATFAVSWALARSWMHRGVEPSLFVGHSVGEFVAAALAGVFDLDDALRLVATRGALIRDLPEGRMLSVRAGLEQVEPFLGEGASLACVNAPALSVVAGPDAAVEALQRRLEAEGISTSVLRTSHAFHSAMMEPVVEPFRQAVEAVRRRPPRIPIVSTVTGQLLTDDDAVDPAYWARHLRAPVRFAEALRTMAALDGADDRIWLEVGPRAATATFARQTLPPALRSRVVASLDTRATADDEVAAFEAARGRLFVAGADAASGRDAHRVSLPGYPFERRRYWIESAPREYGSTGVASDTPIEELIDRQLQILQTQMHLLRQT